MGEPFLITLNFDTALPICIETNSDEPMKRYELIIEIDCSVLKVRLFNRVEAYNIAVSSTLSYGSQPASSTPCQKRQETLF